MIKSLMPLLIYTLSFTVSQAAYANDYQFITNTAHQSTQGFSQKIMSTSVKHKAIIVAGGGPSTEFNQNLIWNETELLTNKAYQALRLQGYQESEIKFLTAGSISSDLNGNKKPSNIEPISLNSLQLAITEWASDAENVVIYLMDHGGSGRFQLNDREILTDTQLKTWVDMLDEKSSGTISIIIEACKSGSFIPKLAGQQRNIITSTDANQPAIISNKGLNSFSYFFWDAVNSGATLQEAFKTGQRGMGVLLIDNQIQNVQLDSNGDHQFNEMDYANLADFCLGKCTKMASNAPMILSVTEDTILSGELSMQLTMHINSLDTLLQAWVSVIPPSFQHADSNEPVSELTQIPLDCDSTLRCTATVSAFDTVGDYQVIFYAQNQNYQQALPISITISQTEEVPPTSTYNDVNQTLYIEDVQYGYTHYQVELIHYGDFIFTTRAINELNGQWSQHPDQYDSIDSTLILNKVSAYGGYYKMVLRNLGGLVFKLETREKLH
jgi:hypothetical protein